MLERDLWRWLAERLAAGEAAVLAAVVEHSAGSPGRAGFKLAVTAKDTAGSVGGGAVEHRVIETARRGLAGGACAAQRLAFRHRLEADAGDDSRLASGMVCGGGQSVALLRLEAKDMPAVAALAEGTAGRLRLSAAGLAWLPTDAPRDAAAWYEERYPQQARAYLIGGGHVSLALSQVLALLDFDVTVLEQRSGLSTLARNRYARRILPVDYRAVAAAVPDGEDVYVLAMTHAPHWDAIVLRQLLGKRLRYLGALGSAAKAAYLRERLVCSASVARLAALRLPAGLPIHSHTPMEIAVSIAAEMVGIRNDGALAHRLG